MFVEAFLTKLFQLAFKILNIHLVGSSVYIFKFKSMNVNLEYIMVLWLTIELKQTVIEPLQTGRFKELPIFCSLAQYNV